MVIEEQQLEFWTWLLRNGLIWLATMIALSLLVNFFIFLGLAASRGPGNGWKTFWRGWGSLLRDWRQTSWRRVFAMAKLACQETIRARVVVAFILFLILLMFGGLFLDESGERPARVYLNFVLSVISLLMVVLMVLLSTFSLPTDIQRRTIYTVVSKPVRRQEIILGRILGFMATGTLLLALMGGISYYFVWQGLSHTHTVTAEQLVEVPIIPGDENPIVKKGRTEQEHGHRHDIVVYQDGTIKVSDAPGHYHIATQREVGDKVVYDIGSPEEILKARIPVYGELTYLNREGEQSEVGINVGKEWTYRSCIDGGTKAAAIWNFKGITPERFPRGLPLELTQGIFRTHKGDIEKGVTGSIILRNPKVPSRATSPRIFEAKEYYTQQFFFGTKLDSPDSSRKLDLFQDLVADGELQIEIRCEERAQFFCLAGPDLYLRAADANFELNYIKGYAGILLQMLLVTTFGVFFSTFLRGSVAMVTTLAIIIAGYSTDFMLKLATGGVPGGGPAENALRLFLQTNLVIDLQDGPAKEFVKFLDFFLQPFMLGTQRIVPDLLAYNDANYLANGFNIDPIHLTQHALSAFAFFIPLVIGAHACLKFRQVAE